MLHYYKNGIWLSINGTYDGRQPMQAKAAWKRGSKGIFPLQDTIWRQPYRNLAINPSVKKLQSHLIVRGRKGSLQN